MEIDLKTDSRKVKPGDTFIAIRNVNRDGNRTHVNKYHF